MCRVLFFFPFLLVPLLWFELGFSTVNQWLHNHRWQIGAGIVIVAVLLDISGSSLGMWNFWMGSDLSQDVVFGTPRASRTDEYSVMTPRAFAQDYSNYSYFNHLQGATSSDMFLIKDAPVWVIAEVFRPFHWGYLLLGSSRGLAYYWSARLVVLFLAVYELCLLLTRDDRTGTSRRDLSLIGACLVTFAPIVQWWFAINSLPEMIIAMSLATVVCDRFCADHDSLHRFGYSMFIAWCAGTFLITLYPAWQIPLVWVLLALFIGIIARFWGSIRFTRKDAISVLVSILVLVALLATVVYFSRPTIKAMLGTSYPGVRKNTGGDYGVTGLFAGTSQLLFPYMDMKPFNSWSPTELSCFIDLFPLGLILCARKWFSRRHADVLSVALVVVGIFLFIYICVGVPRWLSTITLMTQTSGGRARAAFGLTNILLLVIGSAGLTQTTGITNNASSIDRRTQKADRIFAGVTVTVLLIVYSLAAIRMYQMARVWYFCVLIVVLGLPLLLAVLTPPQGASACTGDRAIARTDADTAPGLRRTHTISATLAVMILVCTGLSVNPVQLGARPLTQQPQTTTVKAIEQAHGSGTWLTAGDDSWLTGNLLPANGITTLNSLAVTPDLATWEKIDPGAAHKTVYNRYASITAWVNSDADQKQKFQLLYPDHFSVKLTPDELHTLGVRYVMDSSGKRPSAGKNYRLRQLGRSVGKDRFYMVIKK